MAPFDDGPRCGICGERIKDGELIKVDDTTMFKALPDKGVVRVHIRCVVKARNSTLGN